VDISHETETLLVDNMYERILYQHAHCSFRSKIWTKVHG